MPHTIKNKTLSQRGNAMIYVLIALALFGFLTMTLSRSNDQADGQDIDDEQAALYATELIEYVASAQNAVDMMVASGSEINDLNFVNPTSVGFNTTPPKHYNKVYHPQGGGLSYKGNSYDEAFFSGGTRGWQNMTVTNVEWTSTPAHDIIFTFMDINPKLCAYINKKITDSIIIPTSNAVSFNSLFRENASGTPVDFIVADCANCEGFPSLCISNSTATQFHFYNIIAAQ